MNRFIFLIFGLFAGIVPAFAQMMPDSTVNVVAYWEVGDKYNYQVEEAKYKVVGSDTTDVQLSAHIMTVEIVDATDTTYRVRVHTDDYQNSDYEQMAMTDEVVELFGNTPFEFETDEYGTFKRLLIDDEDWDAIFAMVDAIVEKIAESQDSNVQEQAVFKQMMRSLFTKEMITELYLQEFAPLLQFHGLQFTPGEEAEYEQEIHSVFGDDSTIRMDGRIWADKELTDDYSVVILDESEADPKGMQQYVIAFLGQTLASAGLDAYEMEAAFADAEISLRVLVFEEIHLDTGWPLDFETKKIIGVRGDGVEQQQVQFKAVTIILEDEEEEDPQD